MNNFARKYKIVKFLKTYMLKGLEGCIDTTTPELYNKFVAYHFVYCNLLENDERDIVGFVYVRRGGNVKRFAEISGTSQATAYRLLNRALAKFYNVEV